MPTEPVAELRFQVFELAVLPLSSVDDNKYCLKELPILAFTKEDAIDFIQVEGERQIKYVVLEVYKLP